MPFAFRPEAYGPTVAALLATPRLPPLGPGRLDPTAAAALRALDPTTALGPVANLDAARACLAGLWLHFDGLTESHEISQALDTREGSFWHAIMHRREPDPSNSKYWWRRVGDHPVLDRLKAEAPALGYYYTDPFDFVDLCERVRGSGTPEEDAAKRVQLLEWQLLFDYCFQAAVGR